MLHTFIAIASISAIIAFWAVSTQRKLVGLDENVGNAMNQVGVQLSGCFDALTVLLDLTKTYAGHESETLLETVKSGRSAVAAKSTPEEVLRQEQVIADALETIATMAEQYPELKANQTYRNNIDAVKAFEIMLRTSRLIYNASVTKLNREIRLFPVSVIAGILGFRQRAYLVEQEEKTHMPA